MDDKESAIPPEKKPVPTPAKTKSNLFQRFILFLFNKESRLGRFNRAATRILAFILGLFALGLLAGYLLLFRPLQQQHAQLQTEFDKTRATATALSDAQKTDQQNLATLQAKEKDLTASLAQANDHIHLLQLFGLVRQAQLGLDAKDTVGVRQLLLQIRTELVKSSTLIDQAGPNRSNMMIARLDLILGELESAPTTAVADLTILAANFTQTESDLFK
jgi:hypothetical protein